MNETATQQPTRETTNAVLSGCFAVTVESDDAPSPLCAGDTVLVDPDVTPQDAADQDGKIALVRPAGTDRPGDFRRLAYRDGELYVLPNESPETQGLVQSTTDGCDLVGVVRGRYVEL